MVPSESLLISSEGHARSPVCPVTHEEILSQAQGDPASDVFTERKASTEHKERGAGHPNVQFTTQERVPAGGGRRGPHQTYPHHQVSPCRALGSHSQLPSWGAPAGCVGPCDQLFSEAWSLSRQPPLWNTLPTPAEPRGYALTPTVSTLRGFGLAVETHSRSFLKDDTV